MNEQRKAIYEFTKGIIKENPVLVTLLGMCPTLAVTVLAENGIGMGLATTFVLVCSNAVISLLKNVIPKAVRLPCFIVIIAGFVTFIDFMMKGYLPQLHSALGVFLQLITVNCIILGRAEAFASRNSIGRSVLDVNKIANRKPPVEISCANCPNASACKGQCKAEEGA